MTQQVNYYSKNTITADPKLIRRLRWGVFLGIIAGAIPLLFTLVYTLYVLVETLGITRPPFFLPNPFVLFWLMLLFLTPSAWLLTKVVKPRSFAIFIEMLLLRAGLALLIAGLCNDYRQMSYLFEFLNAILDLTPRVVGSIVVYSAWNMVVYAILHLTARNLRLVGLGNYARAVMIWVVLFLGWWILSLVSYLAVDIFPILRRAFITHQDQVLLILQVLLAGLLVMIEIIAIKALNALRRIKK